MGFEKIRRRETVPGGGSSNAYNGNRAIKRAPFVGVNPMGTTTQEFLDGLFYPFVPATIVMSPSGLHEVGSSPQVTQNILITPNDEVQVMNRKLFRDGVLHVSFVGNNNNINYSEFLNFNSPRVFSYHATVDAGNNGNPTVLMSNTATRTFIYPFLYGVSSNAALSGTALYTALTKLLQQQSNKTLPFSGTGVYLYFTYPEAYPNLTQILDPNGFDVTASFTLTTVSVTSTGLTTNYTTNYKVYRSNALASPNGNFQFRF